MRIKVFKSDSLDS